MTPALLTRSSLAEADLHRLWLDEALEALLREETAECLVCGEQVELNEERVECGACGSALEPGPRVDPGQLTLV
jgi:Zn finger protein HypA/HybF involved in hydrogenase expression